MSLVSTEVENLDSLQTLLPFRQDQVIGKKVDIFNLHFRAMGNQFLPIRLAGIGNRRSYHAKVLRSLVCSNVKEVAAMIDVVFVIRFARADCS